MIRWLMKILYWPNEALDRWDRWLRKCMFKKVLHDFRNLSETEKEMLLGAWSPGWHIREALGNLWGTLGSE